MRKSVVLSPPDERGNWWLLPVLGDYGQDGYPLNSVLAPIVTFEAAPQVQLAAGYFDLRQAAVVNRRVYIRGHWTPTNR